MFSNGTVVVVNRKNGMERSRMSVSVQKVTSVENLQLIMRRHNEAPSLLARLFDEVCQFPALHVPEHASEFVISQ